MIVYSHLPLLARYKPTTPPISRNCTVAIIKSIPVRHLCRCPSRTLCALGSLHCSCSHHLITNKYHYHNENQSVVCLTNNPSTPNDRQLPAPVPDDSLHPRRPCLLFSSWAELSRRFISPVHLWSITAGCIVLDVMLCSIRNKEI
jgi:hypothetical protein